MFSVPESRVFHFDSPEMLRMFYAPTLSELKDPMTAELGDKVRFSVFFAFGGSLMVLLCLVSELFDRIR